MTRGANGLITHVDGIPVNEYMQGVADHRTAMLRQRIGDGRISEAELGKVYGLGIDLRTGRLMEAINGQGFAFTPINQMHPVIGDRLEDIRRAGPYPNFDNRGNPIPPGDRRGPTTVFPHFESNPTLHAEVKIANELLGRRGPDVTAAAMSEFRMDTRFVDHSHPAGSDDARFCATCNKILAESWSGAGRNTYKPGDPRNEHLPPE